MRIEKFIKKKPYEEIVCVLRRHPLIFLRDVAGFLVLLGVPLAARDLIAVNYPTLLEGFISRPILTLLGSAYLLFVWLLLYAHFMDYYLDTWIVTNDRIINIEQEGIFARTISELDLYKIQDTTSEVKGIAATFFKYGNVYIQTAAEKQRFVFEQISDPHSIREKVTELVKKDRQYHIPEQVTESVERGI